MTEIRDILAQRQKNYDNFADNAKISRQLLEIIEGGKSWIDASYSIMEAIHHICTRLGRLSTGNFFYEDGWRDIAGYATLVADEIAAENASSVDQGQVERVAKKLQDAILDELTKEIGKGVLSECQAEFGEIPCPKSKPACPVDPVDKAMDMIHQQAAHIQDLLEENGPHVKEALSLAITGMKNRFKDYEEALSSMVAD